ncbi:MAG: hypothetical protein R6W82_03100 [bacterium]
MKRPEHLRGDMRTTRWALILPFALLTTWLSPYPALAQKDAREVLDDHSAQIQAGDLLISFIYLRPETASTILTSEEFARFEEERRRLPPDWSLMAVRVRPYRDARFDPTLISLEQREHSHPVGFMDVVDVRNMFTSTLSRGESAFGFLKVPDRIDFRREVLIRYENSRAQFLLPMKWRQRYFRFLDGPPPHANR